MDIRGDFRQYFVDLGHAAIPSAPLIPNDPTLLFTSAGMVQFKDIFLGKSPPPPEKKAVTVQKCLRAGGKHNDLHEVGRTARHHTFFEMLGNFSFGAYFKEEAILAASRFLFDNLGLSRERVVVTVYHTDDEAYRIWSRLVKPEQIVRIATSDNFWQMGETGPCGPCTEIFYDHGEKVPGGRPGEPDADGNRFVEIWNIVFMQYAQGAGKRVTLQTPAIDTGMGLERITAVLEGVVNNFDSSLFLPLVQAVGTITGTRVAVDGGVHHYILADHVRAASFLIAEGLLPGPEGRGYVLRRIIRRAVRHAHHLGWNRPILHRLFPTLREIMGDAYPELGQHDNGVRQVLKEEEEKFLSTLKAGMDVLAKAMGRVRRGILPGKVAFELYDTYGFPLDLTEEIVQTKNVHVDREGFDARMGQHRLQSRRHWTGSGDMGERDYIHGQDAQTNFVGYKAWENEASVSAMADAKGERRDLLKKGESGIVVLEKTPFYAESGGQVGDMGTLRSPSGGIFTVRDTQKKGRAFLHLGNMEEGEMHVGETVRASIDTKRREAIRRHHTSIHLLHRALQARFGAHALQKGSWVGPRSARLDFVHKGALTKEDRDSLEHAVNEEILKDLPVKVLHVPYEEAREMGALALFGEKYPEKVRVIKVGDYSMELCGGTHVDRTGQIGSFRILKSGSVASGVKRLECCVAWAALDAMQSDRAFLERAMTLLRVGNLEDMEKKILQAPKPVEKKLSWTIKKMPSDGEFGVAKIEGMDSKGLKGGMDQFLAGGRKRIGVAVSKGAGGKWTVVIGTSRSMEKQHAAVDLLSAMLGPTGGGGGSAHMAQGGFRGEEPAMEKALQSLSQRLEKN